MKKLVSLSAAAAILAGSMAVTQSADARPGYRGQGPGYGSGYRYRRSGRGGAVAGAAVVGIAGALIGGAIAQSQARQYGPAYGYEPAPAYGYGAPAYGYGAPAPAYGYGYGYAPGYYRH